MPEGETVIPFSKRSSAWSKAEKTACFKDWLPGCPLTFPFPFRIYLKVDMALARYPTRIFAIKIFRLAGAVLPDVKGFLFRLFK